MSRVTMALVAPPAAGKTTLMMFLIQNLIRIGAIDWEIPLGDTYRMGENTPDHSKGIATETYDLEIDFDKVVEAIEAEASTLHIQGAIDSLLMSKATVGQFFAMMTEALDEEMIDRSDRITVALDRAIP